MSEHFISTNAISKHTDSGSNKVIPLFSSRMHIMQMKHNKYGKSSMNRSKLKNYALFTPSESKKRLNGTFSTSKLIHLNTPKTVQAEILIENPNSHPDVQSSARLEQKEAQIVPTCPFNFNPPDTRSPVIDPSESSKITSSGR